MLKQWSPVKKPMTKTSLSSTSKTSINHRLTKTKPIAAAALVADDALVVHPPKVMIAVAAAVVAGVANLLAVAIISQRMSTQETSILVAAATLNPGAAVAVDPAVGHQAAEEETIEIETETGIAIETAMKFQPATKMMLQRPVVAAVATTKTKIVLAANEVVAEVATGTTVHATAIAAMLLPSAMHLVNVDSDVTGMRKRAPMMAVTARVAHAGFRHGKMPSAESSKPTSRLIRHDRPEAAGAADQDLAAEVAVVAPQAVADALVEAADLMAAVTMIAPAVAAEVADVTRIC